MGSCFGCVYGVDGATAIRLVSPSPFSTFSSWEELQQMSSSKPVVALGVFDWSNYSHEVMNAIIVSSSWFERNKIALAAFCLGDSTTIQTLCPPLLPHIERATTEPAVLLIDRGSLAKVRFGRIDIESLKKWVASRGEAADQGMDMA